jgi:hypothetical protein
MSGFVQIQNPQKNKISPKDPKPINQNQSLEPKRTWNSEAWKKEGTENAGDFCCSLRERGKLNKQLKNKKRRKFFGSADQTSQLDAPQKYCRLDELVADSFFRELG